MAARRLRVALAAALAAFAAEARLASGSRQMTAADYEPERPDGRTAKAMTWAMMKLRQNNRPGARPFLKDRETFLKWRADFLKGYAKHREGVPDDPEFRLLRKERRETHTLFVYECFPFEGLALKTMVLVPDGAKPGRTPVVICMPGGGGSLEGLSGEPDPYFTRYPVRNRQAWWYAQAGMIGVAFENPGNASQSFDDMHYISSIRNCELILRRIGMSLDDVPIRGVGMAIRFLRRNPLVDPERIAVSGLSRGCSILNAALAFDEVKACVYNDFMCDDVMRRMVTNLKSGETDAGGGLLFAAMAFAPRPLLLNEGGGNKGVIEDIRRAYELMGHPENLSVHHYDRYADPAARPHDGEDQRALSGLSPEDYLAYNNCDPYDHSFHAESALPWVRGLFLDAADIPDSLLPEIARARAERERTPEELYPPDGKTGRKAFGYRRVTERDYVPERADGRTGKLFTWAVMEWRRRLVAKRAAVADRFRLLSTRKRQGYSVETYEFYPDDDLAVKAMVLVPDGFKPLQTQVGVYFGGENASVESVAGEPDPYETPGDAHPALDAVRQGLIAVALALPGVANGAPDDIDSADSRRRYLALLPESGWTDSRLRDTEKQLWADYLKGRME